jgi:hypothetical protein
MRPLAVLVVLYDGLLHDHGAGDVDDDARLTGCRQAAAKRLDEADGRLSGRRRQLQHDLRQLDEDAVRIGEGEYLELDGALQADDEARAACVALERGFLSRCGGGGLGGLGRRRLLGRCGKRKGSRAERCPKGQ